MIRPNLYKILGLDPEVTQWEAVQARIEQALQQASRLSTVASPSEQRIADCCRYWFETDGEGLEILQDEQHRFQEAAEWQSQIQADRVRLRSLVLMLKKRGDETEADRELIARSVLPQLTAEVDTCREREASPPDQTPGQRMSSATWRLIAAACASAGLSDLYEYLGIGPKATLDTVQQACHKRDELVSKMSRGSTRRKVETRLLALAKQHLTSGSSRVLYDKSLNWQSLSILDTYIKLRCGDSKRLDDSALVDILVTAAIPDRVTIGDCRDYVEEWVAAKRGWSRTSQAQQPE